MRHKNYSISLLTLFSILGMGFCHAENTLSNQLPSDAEMDAVVKSLTTLSDTVDQTEEAEIKDSIQSAAMGLVDDAGKLAGLGVVCNISPAFLKLAVIDHANKVYSILNENLINSMLIGFEIEKESVVNRYSPYGCSTERRNSLKHTIYRTVKSLSGPELANDFRKLYIPSVPTSKKAGAKK